jgi:hypothetical protein
MIIGHSSTDDLRMQEEISFEAQMGVVGSQPCVNSTLDLQSGMEPNQGTGAMKKRKRPSRNRYRHRQAKLADHRIRIEMLRIALSEAPPAWFDISLEIGIAIRRIAILVDEVTTWRESLRPKDMSPTGQGEAPHNAPSSSTDQAGARNLTPAVPKGEARHGR